MFSCSSFSTALVAPFAGAWIEIISSDSVSISSGSLPSRERGLKYKISLAFLKYVVSLPSRERGLKLNIRLAIVRRQLVAPFAGAWIEISYLYPFFAVMFVAPFAGAWIEI